MKAARPAIELDDVCASYGSESVLRNVTLRVNEGEFVGLVGPNGGGKSTLLRATLGLMRTTCGTVNLFGEPLASFKSWTRVGYVPQNAVQVDPRFPATAFEVALLGRVAKRGLLRRLNAEDREAAREALRIVGMDAQADRLIGSLSGGQRQRVFLAKALAAKPSLLLLDEPTTGVDPHAREGFYNLLDRLNHDHGITLVLVSHDTQAIALSAHRLVAVNRAVVYDGLPNEFEKMGGYAAAYGLHVHHDHGVTP